MAKDVKYIFNTYLRLIPSVLEELKKFCGHDPKSFDYSKYLNVYLITQRLVKNDIIGLDEWEDNYIFNFHKRLLNNYEDKIKSIDFRLINLNEKTFNKDNYEEHEYSYQRMRDVNVKKILFPAQDTDESKEYLKNCNATGSIDYDAAKTAYLANIKTDSKYKSFTNDYDIYEKPRRDGSIPPEIYKSNDYFRLNVKEDKIIENEIVLLCDDLSYSNKNADSPLNTGVYGFLLTYGCKPKDEKLESEIKYLEFPMMLYQYAKPTYSNYNKIKLVFNVNGLFGVV